MTRTHQPHSMACLAASLLLMIGCGQDDMGVGRNDVAVGSPCPLPQLTQPCSSCGVGRQICTASGWGACECADDGSGGPGAGASVTQGALRTDITFDWAENVDAGPGGGDNCLPGTYEGEYVMDFTPVALGAPVPTVGPFVISFGTERKGEFLQTAEGSTLEVHFLEPTINATMPLEGGVNCNTGEFIADAVNCTFDSLGIPAGSCTAHLEGQFNRAAGTIEGTIVSDSPGYGSGEGTWAITLTP